LTAIRVSGTHVQVSDGRLGHGINVEAGDVVNPSTSPASAQIADSLVDDNIATGVMAYDAEVSFVHSRVAGTKVKADGDYGYGLAVVSSPPVKPTLAISDSMVDHNARAGVTCFYASKVRISGSTFECNSFDLDYELGGKFVDEGANVCGCDGKNTACAA